MPPLLSKSAMSQLSCPAAVKLSLGTRVGSRSLLSQETAIETVTTTIFRREPGGWGTVADQRLICQVERRGSAVVADLVTVQDYVRTKVKLRRAVKRRVNRRDFGLLRKLASLR
jgi:hypothetical protein